MNLKICCVSQTLHCYNCINDSPPKCINDSVTLLPPQWIPLPMGLWMYQCNRLCFIFIQLVIVTLLGQLAKPATRRQGNAHARTEWLAWPATGVPKGTSRVDLPSLPVSVSLSISFSAVALPCSVTDFSRKVREPNHIAPHHRWCLSSAGERNNDYGLQTAICPRLSTWLIP